MMLEPRKVEPGFGLRWLKQAVGLLGRSFHLWFGLALTWCLLCWALQGNGLASIGMGFFFYFFSVEMAAMSDQQVVRLGHLPQAASRAAQGALREMWDMRYALLLAGLLALALLWSQQTDPEVQAAIAAKAARTPTDLGDPFTWLFSAESPFMHGALSLLAAQVLQAYGTRLASLRYPLRRAFELTDAQAAQLLRKAGQKNRGVQSLEAAAIPLFLVVAAVLLPGATPLLACVLPALSYVAFREIFIDDQGNRKAVAHAHRSPIAGVLQ